MQSRQNDIDNIRDRLLNAGVVGYRVDDGDIRRPTRLHTFIHQTTGIDQQPGAHPFFKTVLFQIPHLGANQCQALCQLRINTGFMGNDGGFLCFVGIVELQ